MDLRQIVCYMEGYESKLASLEISNVILAARTGSYTGQYWTGKRATDPRQEIKKIEESARYNDKPTISDEEQIKRAKKAFKYFK